MLGRGQSSDCTHYSSSAVHRTLNRYLHTEPCNSEDDSVGDTRGGQLDEQQVQCVGGRAGNPVISANSALLPFSLSCFVLNVEARHRSLNTRMKHRGHNLSWSIDTSSALQLPPNNSSSPVAHDVLEFILVCDTRCKIFLIEIFLHNKSPKLVVIHNGPVSNEWEIGYYRV